MTSLINQLKEGWKNKTTIKSIIGQHGELTDGEITITLGFLSQQQAMSQVFNLGNMATKTWRNNHNKGP